MESIIISHEEKYGLFVVGQYIPMFNLLTNNTLPCGSIFQSNGFFTHILKRHPSLSNYIDKIPESILKPDYIGTHPKKPNSLELIKCYKENILLAIELDTNNGYLYVSSLYDITDSKLHNRLNSGRLKTFT